MSRSDGYTGHLFEEEVLGKCVVAYRGQMRYVTRKEAEADARKSQPKQKAPVAALLEKEIGRQLGANVRYYTAVRTALDLFHGVDAFFEFEGLVVTLDVTTNPHKDACKADLLVHADELSSMQALRELAGRVTREFTTKQRRAR